MSKAPYRHSDGSDCYTKECSLGNVSVHAPRAGSFSRASANLRLTRPVEVEEVTYVEEDDEEYDDEEDGYDRDGFAEGGVLDNLCNAGTNGSPEIRSFLITNGITERNGWAEDEEGWSSGWEGGRIYEGVSDMVLMIEPGDYFIEVRTYGFQNAATGATFFLYGSQDMEMGSVFTTHLTRGAAVYEIWSGADDAQEWFTMDMEGPELAEAIEFSSDPRLIRWARLMHSSSEASNAIHTTLLKMFPGSEDVPVEWLLKMMD